jgi:hypothetical protein
MLVGPATPTGWVFERWPVGDRLVVGIRRPPSRESCPVAGHGAEELLVRVAERVVRGGAEVVAEQEVDLESVNGPIRRDRIDLVCERIGEYRRPCALHQASHTAGLADVLGIANNRSQNFLPSQNHFGGLAFRHAVNGGDRCRIGSELRGKYALVLPGGQAVRETTIYEPPALIPVGADHQGHRRDGAALEQRARLIGKLASVDDGPPLDALSLENLIGSDRQRVQHLVARA